MRPSPLAKGQRGTKDGVAAPLAYALMPLASAANTVAAGGTLSSEWIRLRELRPLDERQTLVKYLEDNFT